MNNISKKGVFITVNDRDGNKISQFEAQKDISILGQSNQKKCEIPLACGSGACMVCACKIISGEEYIDTEKFGKQLIEPGDNVILSCVAGVKDEFFDKDGYFEIVIQKII